MMKKLILTNTVLFFLSLFAVVYSQSWLQLGNDIDGEGIADQSGSSIALSSDGLTVAIGAPFNGNNHNGHVRTFHYTGSTWQQLGSDISHVQVYQLNPPPPTVYYVSTTGSDANDGSSWSNSFLTLQHALSVAQSGEQIWVAKGTYYPDEGTGANDGDRNATFSMKNGVEIYGGFAGTEMPDFDLNTRDFETNETILSGDIDKDDLLDVDNSNRVFSNSGIDNTAILDGFTISGGYNNSSGGTGGGMYNSQASPTINNCIFKNNFASFSGGGMDNSSSSPILNNCYFVENESNEGGGMYNFTSSAVPTLNACVFEDNEATLKGGGVYNFGSSGTFDNCDFIGNTTQTATSQQEVGGGGMYNFFSSPIINNCLFQANISAQDGGGVYNLSSSSPTISNTIFKDNISQGEESHGGGMSSEEESDAIVYNCVFVGNEAYSGAGIFIANSDPVITNCTIQGNIASISGGGIRNASGSGGEPSSVTLTNSIVWDNDQIFANDPDPEDNIATDAGSSTITITNSLIENSGGSGVNWVATIGIDGGNNIDADPLFFDTDNGDLRITNDSPAIDTGTNSADLDGSGMSTTTIADIATDLAGNTRIFNSAVDIGAFENDGNLVLPIELIAFDGKVVKEGILLRWQTASEENNEGFYIEKSVDAKLWKPIGFVVGAGTTIETQQYTYLDESPSSGVNYYRLQQIDFDGEFEYSDMIAIDFRKDLHSLSIYPNPTRDKLYLQGFSSSVSVQIFNSQGVAIRKWIMPQPNSLDISDLQAGSYLILVNTNSETIEKWIIIQ